VLLAGAVLLAVLLAGESSRAMLASARLSCLHAHIHISSNFSPKSVDKKTYKTENHVFAFKGPSSNDSRIMLRRKHLQHSLL